MANLVLGVVLTSNQGLKFVLLDKCMALVEVKVQGATRRTKWEECPSPGIHGMDDGGWDPSKA